MTPSRARCISYQARGFIVNYTHVRIQVQGAMASKTAYDTQESSNHQDRCVLFQQLTKATLAAAHRRKALVPPDE